MRLRVEGRPAYVYTGGRTSAAGQPTVLFVHGAGNDHSVWLLQSRYFAHHGWNVLAPDLPGHGQSEGPPLASVEALAAWLRCLLDARGVAGALVVGHSMGSLAALALAAGSPAQVGRLALIGTAVPMMVSDTLLAAARDEEERARRMIVDWSFAPSSHLGNAQKVPSQWLPGLALALMRRQPAGVLATDLAACHAYADGLAAAERTQAPALVIIGERDLMTPPKAAQAVCAALRARTATTQMAPLTVEHLPEAGHSMLSEAPDAVLAVLWRFANTG